MFGHHNGSVIEGVDYVGVVWLNQEIEYISRSEPDRKVVVFTHFCSSTHDMVVGPRHRNSKISSAFMTDLSSEPCWEKWGCQILGFWSYAFQL